MDEVRTLADLHQDTKNARSHNPRNVGMIVEALGEVGAARSGVIDEDGRILAGNATFEALAEAGIERVRVVETDGKEWVVVRRSGLTEDQKRRLALYDNRTAELAGWDPEVLAEFSTDGLLEGLWGEEELGELLADLQLPGSDDEEESLGIDDFSGELEGAFMLKPDMRFDSREPFGIPPLREDRLFHLDDSLTLWPGDDLSPSSDDGFYFLIYSCSCRRLDFSRAILAFYTDDHRFEHLWARPDVFVSKAINAGMRAVVAPNYSLWHGQAPAVHIWNTYRSRWIARYFQEAGIEIIPDVNWAGPESFDFCFAGVPTGAPIVALQLQTIRRDDEMEQERVRAGMREAMSRLSPQAVIVYGSKLGQELADEVLPESLPQFRLPTLMDLRRDKLTNRL